MTKRASLVIGFSYGLRADGSPGNANTRLSELLSAALTAQSSNRVVGAAQWEIVDALASRPAGAALIEEHIPTGFVAPPPAFAANEIPRPRVLVEYLREALSPPEAQLRRQLESRLGATVDAQALAVALNDLIADVRFYEAFAKSVDIHDLYRPDKGAIGIEKRRLPSPSEYAKGLRRYQARRVNRLIIEAIVPAALLRRGEYLNTKAVANQVFQQAVDEDIQLDRIGILGHPEHRDWCKKCILAVISEKGLRIESSAVTFADDSTWTEEALWDPSCAQVWCRTLPNWESYVKM